MWKAKTEVMVVELEDRQGERRHLVKLLSCSD